MARSSNFLRTALILVVAGVAAYWWWSPLMSLQKMRDAVKTSDAVTFNQHVDYPKLRASLKGEIGAQLDNATAAVGAPVKTEQSMLGKLLMDRFVDALVQPEAVMQIMRRGVLKESNEPQPPESDSDKLDWISERVGVNTFIAYVGKPSEPQQDRIGMVLERDGFAHWRLTGLRMPSLQK